MRSIESPPCGNTWKQVVYPSIVIERTALESIWVNSRTVPSLALSLLPRAPADNIHVSANSLQCLQLLSIFYVSQQYTVMWTPYKNARRTSFTTHHKHYDFCIKRTIREIRQSGSDKLYTSRWYKFNTQSYPRTCFEPQRLVRKISLHPLNKTGL